MKKALRIVQEILSFTTFLFSRLCAFVWPQILLHNDRLATDREVKRLVHKTSNGLVLGVDHFGRLLTVQATKERPYLGHLAVFGPTGSGKTTRGEEQVRTWQGPVIVNDPKFSLSTATAAFRKQRGKVYFFSPSEGAGDTYD